MNHPANTVLVATIGAAHGLKGEVRVKSYTGDPLALASYKPLFDSDGRTYRIAAIRPSKTVVIVKFKTVNTRDDAETLSGRDLFVDRSALPETTGEEEFYHADLIGLDARTANGISIGTIRAVHNFGAGDMLEIAGRGRNVAIPFSRAAVPSVDIAAGHVIVDPDAAGLDDTGDHGKTSKPGSNGQ